MVAARQTSSGPDGYKQRFGLVYVDYQNQKRVPQDSFDWYWKLIASNGEVLAERTAVPITNVTRSDSAHRPHGCV